MPSAPQLDKWFAELSRLQQAVAHNITNKGKFLPELHHPRRRLTGSAALVSSPKRLAGARPGLVAQWARGGMALATRVGQHNVKPAWGGRVTLQLKNGCLV